MAIITGERLRSLISNVISDIQFQPAGIDLTLAEIHELIDSGSVDFDNTKRKLSRTKKLDFNSDNYIDLKPGIYKIIYNEVVQIPNNAIALGFPRSTLLRCGATIECAVWDPGYVGRSESLLMVNNINGIRIYKNARVLQLIFIETDKQVLKTYDGIYKGENIKK